MRFQMGKRLTIFFGTGAPLFVFTEVEKHVELSSEHYAKLVECSVMLIAACHRVQNDFNLPSSVYKRTLRFMFVASGEIELNEQVRQGNRGRPAFGNEIRKNILYIVFYHSNTFPDGCRVAIEPVSF